MEIGLDDLDYMGITVLAHRKVQPPSVRSGNQTYYQHSYTQASSSMCVLLLLSLTADPA